MRGKIFTRNEADRMVPLIRRIVLSVRARDRLCARKRRLLADPGLEPESRARLKGQLERLASDLKRHAEELGDLGCILRDRSLGLIECFGELDGDIVYFTWRPGEDRFRFWHSLDTGPTCAVPLPDFEQTAAV